MPAGSTPKRQCCKRHLPHTAAWCRLDPTVCGCGSPRCGCRLAPHALFDIVHRPQRHHPHLMRREIVSVTSKRCVAAGGLPLQPHNSLKRMPCCLVCGQAKQDHLVVLCVKQRRTQSYMQSSPPPPHAPPSGAAPAGPSAAPAAGLRAQPPPPGARARCGCPSPAGGRARSRQSACPLRVCVSRRVVCA